jgi:hypothetical protein
MRLPNRPERLRNRLRGATVSSTIPRCYFSARDFRETSREAVLREVDDPEEISCFFCRPSKFEAGFGEPIRVFDQQIDNRRRVPRYQASHRKCANRTDTGIPSINGRQR